MLGAQHHLIAELHCGQEHLEPLLVREEHMLHSWQPLGGLHDEGDESVHDLLQGGEGRVEDELRGLEHQLNMEDLGTWKGDTNGVTLNVQFSAGLRESAN